MPLPNFYIRMCIDKMSENYQVSIDRVKAVLPTSLITESLKKGIENSDVRISQIIVNKRRQDSEYYMTSVHYLYRFVNGKIEKWDKKDVSEVTFIKGAPHGKVKLSFSNGETWDLDDITYGRAFDFIQDVKPKEINHAGYDNTIRGEFPQLLDPDHAEEVDRLRKWMQDGHISHYEYDDANPVYPKAGK